VLKEDMGERTESAFELARCKLTLFYDYWQMNEVNDTKDIQQLG
jgi:tRNA (guanine37-N1)-methyltransferase